MCISLTSKKKKIVFSVRFLCNVRQGTIVILQVLHQQRQTTGRAERAFIHPVMSHLAIKVTTKLVSSPKHCMKCWLVSLYSHFLPCPALSLI